MSPKNLPVFNNLKAWFSSSVPRKMKDLWKKQGGKEVDSVKDANFIFSNDATCPDIVDVYESEEFIQGLLAVFHASYIDACLKEKSAHNVAAAQYILLPSEMEDDIQKLAFVHQSTSKNNNAEKISVKEQDQSTTYNPSTSNPNKNTKKVQSATCDPRTSSENTNTNHHQERLSSEPSKHSQRRDPPNIVHAEDIAFRIDDMERIPHIRTLPRFEGDISDFVPGVNGCSLSLKA